MRDDGERATATAAGQARSPGAEWERPAVSLGRPPSPAVSRTDLGGPRTIPSELDDALYYLRHDCVPCAERHFELARSLGATEDDINRVRAQASEPRPE